MNKEAGSYMQSKLDAVTFDRIAHAVHRLVKVVTITARRVVPRSENRDARVIASQRAHTEIVIAFNEREANIERGQGKAVKSKAPT